MASIRILRDSDDPSGFSCGNPDLDRFLRRYAARNQFSLHLGTTYVVEDGGTIAAFATISPGSIQADEFPSTRARRLPRYPLPILRLARMGVARDRQKQGLGSLLLRYVFVRAVEMAVKFGCVGVLVDAKPESVDYTRKFGFEAQDPLQGQPRAVPEPVPMFLDIATIKAACKP